MGHPLPQVLQRRSQTSRHLAFANHRSELEHNPLEPGQPQVGRYYPALDGLRAFAVMLVFLHHYAPLRNVAFVSSFCNWGWLGVQLFFVLSGFLITGILWDGRNASNRLRNFYGRRIVRILPLYYGVWIGALALSPILHWLWSPYYVLWFLHLGNLLRFLPWLHGSGLYFEHLHASSGFMLRTGHLWSLCVEEQFYLLWPWIVFRFRRPQSLVRFCLALITTVPLLRLCTILVWHQTHQQFLRSEALYRLTPFQVDGFAWGALLSILIRGDHGKKMLHQNRQLFGIGFLALVLSFGLFYFQEGSYVSSASNPFVSTLGFTAVDMFGMSLVLLLLRPTSFIAKLFELKPVRRLGVVSYGFYVFHDLLHGLYSDIGRVLAPRHSQTITAVIALAFTWIIAELSFRFYESPMLRLKRFFLSAPV